MTAKPAPDAQPPHLDGAARPADQRRRPAPTRSDIWTAAITCAVALVQLLSLPVMVSQTASEFAADPDLKALVGTDVATWLGEFSSTSFPGLGSLGWWLLLAVVIVQAAMLLYARRAPTTVPIAVAVLPVVAVIASGAAFSIAAVAVCVAGFLIGLRLRGARMWWTAAATALTTAVLSAINLALTPLGAASISAAGGTTLATPHVITVALVGVAQAVIVVGVPLVLALIVAGRRDARTARADRAEALERENAAMARERSATAREHQALVDAAVSRERTAMARDLHDIAAHHMSGIALTASALQRQLDGEPLADGAQRQAAESARMIRGQSTAVLGDLRRLVGLLRDDSAPTAAANALDSIADLVAQRNSTGEAVALRVHRPPAAAASTDGTNSAGSGAVNDTGSTTDGANTGGLRIGPLAQLVGYRMVQEALANAALHAPGAQCTVTIADAVGDSTGDSVVITVRNAPPGAARSAGPPGVGHDASDPSTRGGFGLIGMRERAELVGADLEYGHTVDGGWQVRLRLPAEPETLHVKHDDRIEEDHA